jgi:parvulin-like peptidyl-prolyl isomerase
MRWRKLRGLSLSVAMLMPLGCGIGPAGGADRAAMSPDVLTRMDPGNEGLTAMRAQKPDPAAKPADNPLNLPANAGHGPGNKSARIRAVVNGDAILDEEVMAAAYGNLLNARTDAEREEIYKQKLTELIEREVILQDAFAKLIKGGGQKFLDQLRQAASREFDKQWLQKVMAGNGYKDEAEFRRFMRANGMPLDIVRRQWERNFIAMEYMRHRVEPAINRIGHLQIVEFYEKHPDQFQVDDSVQWQDLFIASARHPSREAARAFAESLAQRIAHGEDFYKLAKEFDNGESCFRENAEGIGRKHGEVKPPEVEPVVFRLRDGQVGPLVELPSGFHVVKVVKRQQAGRRPLDEKVQKEIRDKLRNEVFQIEMKRIVNELKRKAIIEVARDL